MKLVKLMLAVLVLASTTGCVLTKAVTVPMRITGAALSVIPVAGNVADKAIDKAADVVDKLPL
jgi:hypothetical protein